MVLKIKPHKRPVFEKILEYMMNNEDRLFDTKGRGFVISHNLKGNNIKEWTKQFKENETYRQRKRIDSVMLTHEILSWHKDDGKDITIEKLEAMTRQYILLRNPRGIYAATGHFDKDHYHVHICASGVEYKTGKSLRMSKENFGKLKKDIQHFQMEHFPELSKSVVNHGKGEKSRVTDREYQMKQRTDRQSNKEQLINMLNKCYKKAASPKHFLDLLKESGLQTYDRSGKRTGIVFEKQKFRFSRLGFNEDRLEELNKAQNRGQQLTKVRENSKSRTINRNI